METHLNDLKEGFSHAYVRAVAHAAGYFVQEANRSYDGDGIDISIMHRGPGGVVRSPKLDLQLKATEHPVTADPFSFPLDVKNYDELRSEELQVPRMLVAVVVPKNIAEWVSASEQELVMRHCGYWLNLRGSPSTENTSTISVKIPRANLFHVPSLKTIMEHIRNGEGLP
jgi:hypothetical protein